MDDETLLEVVERLLFDHDDVAVAREARRLSEQLRAADEAFVRLAEIQAIIDQVIACIPTTDPEVPWNALLAIRKVLR